MYSSTGNIIKVTRGNAFKSNLYLKTKNGGRYVPEEGDRIILEVGFKRLRQDKKDYAEKGAVLTVEIPSDTLKIRIEPEEIEKLPYDDLVYDVTIIHENGDPDTVIEGKDFIVTKKV